MLGLVLIGTATPRGWHLARLRKKTPGWLDVCAQRNQFVCPPLWPERSSWRDGILDQPNKTGTVETEQGGTSMFDDSSGVEESFLRLPVQFRATFLTTFTSHATRDARQDPYPYTFDLSRVSQIFDCRSIGTGTQCNFF